MCNTNGVVSPGKGGLFVLYYNCQPIHESHLNKYNKLENEILKEAKNAQKWHFWSKNVLFQRFYVLIVAWELNRKEVYFGLSLYFLLRQYLNI